MTDDRGPFLDTTTYPYPTWRLGRWRIGKKTMIATLVILGVAAVATTVVLTQRADNDPRPSRYDRAAMSPPVTDGGFEFIVLNVEYDDPRGFSQPVTVTVTVTNLGNEPGFPPPDSQRVVVDNGADYPLSQRFSDPDEVRYPPLDAGESRDVEFTFDIPAQTVATAVGLHGSVDSPGVTVDLWS